MEVRGVAVLTKHSFNHCAELCSMARMQPSQVFITREDSTGGSMVAIKQLHAGVRRRGFLDSVRKPVADSSFLQRLTVIHVMNHHPLVAARREQSSVLVPARAMAYICYRASRRRGRPSAAVARRDGTQAGGAGNKPGIYITS